MRLPVSFLHSFADFKCFANCSLKRQLNISGMMLSFGSSQDEEIIGNYTSIGTMRHWPIASKMCWVTEDDDDTLSSNFAAARENLVIHMIQGDSMK